jgi:hypothetical protein
MPVKMTNMAKKFSIHGEKKDHKMAIVFSKKAEKFSRHGEKKCHNREKSAIMEKIVSFFPSIQHYVQMKIELPAGPQTFFSILFTPRGPCRCSFRCSNLLGEAINLSTIRLEQQIFSPHL